MGALLFLIAYILFLPLAVINYIVVKNKEGYFKSSAINLDKYANYQYNEGDENPVYSLRFTGTIQTDYPRTLSVDITSVYDTYTSGISPTSSKDDCP